MHTSFNRSVRRVFSVSAAVLVVMLGAGRPADASGRDQDDVSDNLRAFGLTDDGRVVRFATRAPERARTVDFIASLSGADTALVGIDFRVQDGKLYGVGNFGGVYTIDTKTAQATLVNTLTVPLSGKSFGVDFNPAADRLRIVSDTGQNLAHTVNAGGVTASNAMLTYTPPPTAPVVASGVAAAAYTNNDLNQPATGTGSACSPAAPPGSDGSMKQSSTSHFPWINRRTLRAGLPRLLACDRPARLRWAHHP